MFQIMKKPVFIICLIFIGDVSYTQQLKLSVNAKVKAKNITYDISNKFGQKNLLIKNISNKLDLRKQLYKPVNLSVAPDSNDNYSVKRAFRQVFSSGRIGQLVPENAIFITFYLNPEGNILEVRFSLPDNTTLTAEELEKLEIALKQNVKFKLTAPDLEKGDFYEIFQNFKYSSLLKYLEEIGVARPKVHSSDTQQTILVSSMYQAVIQR